MDSVPPEYHKPTTGVDNFSKENWVAGKRRWDMDDGLAEPERCAMESKWTSKPINAASRVTGHIWKGLCVRHFLLTATASLLSGKRCLCHQLNPNATKQKLKSFNGILDLLMNAQDSSSCCWCVESNIFTHWGWHHLNGPIDFRFWQVFFEPGKLQDA